MTSPVSPIADRVRDFLCRLPLERQAGRQLPRLADGSVVGDWFGCELSSVFQPIVEPSSGGVVGHEALLRCLGSGQRDLSPWVLFSANADDDRLVALDRLARTVHALNFIASAGDDGLLFLNVHGRLLAAVAGDHGAAFRKVVDALGFAPERIVIEAPVVASRQADLLSFVLRNYRHNGFRVAVNIESVAQWQALSGSVPTDFIKIGASVLAAEDDGPAALERLRTRAGSARVIVTRVEEKPAVAWPSGALAQGHAYGAPVARPAMRPGLCVAGAG
ncbi:EAL domain-containing protein [Aromatoleum toluvorans]|uniref:EAL domain-containing protein n=1 Tax=Aromatoleum toluvorans TaxID=92002 RepID=A0ABX1PY96_9RHOO|nr:EAL domain-containing protein [Aromatoleum toluvorans]NMG44418.1 EAL domain-containing protein [Aromatoleum toluvorans]